MTDLAARNATAPDENLAAEIEARVRAAGTSFYWGMRVLPADREEPDRDLRLLRR